MTPQPFRVLGNLCLAATFAFAFALPVSTHAETLGSELVQMKLVDQAEGTFVLCDDIAFAKEGVVSAIKFYVSKPDHQDGKFYFYLLHPEGNGEYTVLYASDPQFADESEGERSIVVPNCPVKPGDLVAYLGRGVAFESNSGESNVYRPVNKPLQDGDTVMLAIAGDEDIAGKVPALSQRRTYAIAVEFAAK